MFQKPAARRQEAELSAYEAGQSRDTQWLTNDGVYLGYEVAPPEAEFEAHPLRAEWKLTNIVRGYREDRHLLTIGPNGSGKTRRLLFPNLYFLKDWSIVAIDPKGELFAHTAFHRGRTPGHRVVLFDPFAVVKTTYPKAADHIDCASQGFNPLTVIDPDPTNLRFVDDMRSLAVALIRTDTSNEVYWPLAAQALIKGLAMALRIRDGEAASLVDLRNTLGLPPAKLATFVEDVIENEGNAWPALSASLGEFVVDKPDDRELGAIRRTAKVQTDWLDSPEMQANLEGKGFDFASLKETPTTIYLVLPPEFLATHGVWLRLMIASILRPLLRSVAKPRVPVLFMLDEFAQLGRMEIIENNYALMRGYGVKLWTIWQDLNQAKNLYKERWESFISNSGIVQAFAPQDMTTRKYLSELADERLTWHARAGGSGGLSLSKGQVTLQSGQSQNETNIREPLMYPYELGRMGQGQSVIFTQSGLVHRRYFPDALQLVGVKDMMAEAAAFGV